MDFFLQLVAAGLSVGSVYALIGLGLNLTFWTTRVLNFGQGAVIMFCAMVSAFMMASGIPPIIAIPIALVAMAAFMVVVELVGVRPLLKAKGSMGWVVATLGTGIFLQGFASAVFGSQAVSFPDVFFRSDQYLNVLGAWVATQYIAIFSVSVSFVIAMEMFLRFSTWGYAVRAVAHDGNLASTMGIPVRRIVLISFMVSGVLAGIAGILVSQISGTVDPSFGMHILILSFVAAVVGGIGSAIGALVGGLLLGVVEMLVGGYFDPAAAETVAFAILMIVLAVKPEGLFGKKEAVKV